MTPISRLDVSAMERRDLLGAAPRRPSPLRTDITEEYVQDIERRSQVSLEQTREMLDSTDASSNRLNNVLEEAWVAIAALDTSLREAERHLNRPGRMQRLGQWTIATKTAISDRFKRGVDCISATPITRSISMLAVAILALLVWVWNTRVMGRTWQQPTVYT